MDFKAFKKQLGIETVAFNAYKEGKTKFATVLNNKGESIKMFLSKKADITKPLVVFQGAHNALWVANPGVVVESVEL